MAVIADDYNAVDSAKVCGVYKPKGFELWWLSIWLDGCDVPMTVRFASDNARDDFFKRLVEAMGA